MSNDCTNSCNEIYYLNITVECDADTRRKLSWALTTARSVKIEQIIDELSAGFEVEEVPEASLIHNNLTGVVLDVFSDGQPHPLCEVREAVKAAGYKPASASPCIAKLIKRRALKRIQIGYYEAH